MTKTKKIIKRLTRTLQCYQSLLGGEQFVWPQSKYNKYHVKNKCQASWERKMRTVEAIAAGTLNITFIIELRFKIIKIVARRFAKKLEKIYIKRTSV